MEMSPVGTAEISSGRRPGVAGATKEAPRGGWKWVATQSWISFSLPCGTESSCIMYPGLGSWAKFSCPSGTRFRDGGSHADSLAPEVRFSIVCGELKAEKTLPCPVSPEKRISHLKAVKRANRLRHG